MGRGERPQSAVSATVLRTKRVAAPIHHFGTMSRVVKINRNGQSYAFKRFSSGQNGNNRLSAEQLLRDRGIRASHCAKAEIMADQTIELLGAPYRERVAPVQETKHGGQEGLLVEWVEGQSYRQLSTTGDRYLNQAILAHPQNSSIDTKEWINKARQIVFIDTLIGNSDRHGDNILITDRGPVGIDQGLAFVPERNAPTKARPQTPGVAADQIIYFSGGTGLNAEERRACQRLKEAGWPDLVTKNLGERAGREAAARLDYMLTKDKLHPYITGTDLDQKDPPISPSVKQRVEALL